MTEPVYHVPVLVQEVIEGLRINPKGIYVDGTLGGGGHARAILGHLQEEGRLLVFDQDPDAQLHVPRDPRVTLIPHNFRHLQRFLRLHQVEWLDGLLADLGVSSHQLDTADRGFSTRLEGALDMRMNPHQELT
ncbi:MAG: 16S rRNA (cytosine(1402)-N(4))-methyltransferase, partial [Chitinophagaceae bacterium]